MKKRRRKRNRMPKGMGTVFEMRSKDRYGNYYERKKPWAWRLNGKYMGFYETREEAELEARLYHRDHKESDDITFSQLWELWLEQKKDTVSEGTRKVYFAKYRTNCPSIYDKAYVELRTKDFLECINVKPEAGAGTKNNTIKYLRAMDRFAYELGIIDRQYTLNIQKYKETSKRKNRIFTEEEINYLWDHLEIQDVDLVLILLYTGLRPGELPVIKLEDIYEDHLIGGFKTEAGRDRYIPIHPRIKELINNRVAQAKKDTLLNFGYKAFGEHFRNLMKKLGWNHHPHECRHTFITRLDNAGANQVAIQLIVGHAPNNITSSVYIHKNEKQLQDTIRLLL